jgi:hypothetical protein
MIAYVSGQDPVSDEGWALVGAFVCVYGLIALTTSIYWEKVFCLLGSAIQSKCAARYSTVSYVSVAGLLAVYIVNLSGYPPILVGNLAVV